MSPDQPNRRPTLVDEAEQALRDWLAPGGLRDGDRLPPEHQLAAHLGVSRGTLRSALRRLQETGEVVRRQGSGTFVGRVEELRPFSEGLERLAPYSALARQRGIGLLARDIEISRSAVGERLGAVFGVPATTLAVRVSRVILADEAPVAHMVDVLHPTVRLPPDDAVRDALRKGRMMLDLLLDSGVPVTHSRTRIRARTIGPDDERGALLGVDAPTAALELDETVHVRGGDAVERSTDLFAPGGLDLHVIRHLATERPDPIVRTVRGRSAPDLAGGRVRPGRDASPAA